MYTEYDPNIKDAAVSCVQTDGSEHEFGVLTN